MVLTLSIMYLSLEVIVDVIGREMGVTNADAIIALRPYRSIFVANRDEGNHFSKL